MKLNFQLIITIVFIVAAIVGILVFSGAIPIGSDGEGSQGTVVLWGTVPSTALAGPLEEFNKAHPTFVTNYVEKSQATFDRDLLEALASGKGPDLFFLPGDLAYHYANKIYTIPYASYPVSAFKSAFSGAGEVFLVNEGILAFPLALDPLMLYYNRSMLDAAGIVFPPADWEEFAADVLKLTTKDGSGRITRSAAALGQYANVAHAKDILAALFMQAGNPILREEAGAIKSTLAAPVGTYNLPSILEFYTDFADPANSLYSWNRSLPASDAAFANEDLAFYFGYASELQAVVNRNPNLNFGIAPVPQIKDSKTKLTGARVTGIAVSAFSQNLSTALTAASLLASSDFAAEYVLSQGLAPARRDLLAQSPEDAYSPIFYGSALFARSWLDPSPENTDTIFSGMVNAVLSNNLSVDEAVKDADSKLGLLLLQ